MFAPILPRPTIPIRMHAPRSAARSHDADEAKTTLTPMIDRVVLDDAGSAARLAAGRIAEGIARAVAARGRASVALSGGRSPWVMMRHLFVLDVDWTAVDILQVDERVAPDGDDARNLTHLARIVEGSPAAAARLHPMRVAEGTAAAVADYQDVLAALGGPIDVVHLGLGEDGHTASLVPGDSVLEIDEAPVAATGAPYDGHVRVTLTYPTIDAAKRIVWLVTGPGKDEMARRLEAGDETIPAGRVSPERAILVLDRMAAGA